jgi:hypothetical protein
MSQSKSSDREGQEILESIVDMLRFASVCPHLPHRTVEEKGGRVRSREGRDPKGIIGYP